MSSDGKLVLVAVLSLIALVMLFTILQIHFRHKERRRQASPHRRTTQVALEEIHSIEPTPMKALDPLVVASLPKFMYKATDLQLDHGEVIECSVCLSTIVEETMVKLLPNCKHTFHVECIDMWLNSNTTCPICRTLAEPPMVKPEDSTLCTGVQPLDPPIEGSTAHGTRLSSFQRMLSRERSSRGIQSCGDGGPEDLERQY